MRRKATPFFVSLGIAVLVSLASLACDSTSLAPLRDVLESEESEELDEIEKNKMVLGLMDMSDSTLAYRSEYLEDFAQVFLPLLGYGDKIVITQITEDSIQEAKILVNRQLPTFSPNLDKYQFVEKDNSLVQKALKREIDRQKQDFMEKNDLDTIRKEILDEVADDVLSGRAKFTDIFSTLKLAERIFSADNHREKILVIFSDMREDSSSFNFDKEELTPERIQQILNLEKSRSGLPNLAGAAVYVVGATAGKGGIDQFYRIKAFWEQYFRLTGAQLVDYGRRAINIEH